MNRGIAAAALVGFAGYIWTGDLTVAVIVTGILIAVAGAFTALPPRHPRVGKRWAWGGGLYIPPFHIGGYRRGDDQDLEEE